MKITQKQIGYLAIALMLIPAVVMAQSGNPFEPAENVANEVLSWVQRIGMVIAAIMIVFGGVQVFVFGKADVQRFFQYLIGAILIGVGSQVPAWIVSFTN